jgi:hypothetical protein
MAAGPREYFELHVIEPSAALAAVERCVMVISTELAATHGGPPAAKAWHRDRRQVPNRTEIRSATGEWRAALVVYRVSATRPTAIR